MSFPVTHDHSSSMSDDTFDSDDSQEDPTFDFLDETRSSFSRLSVKEKPKSWVKEKEEGTVEEPDVVEMVVPEIDEKDEKNYDIIQKVIQEGEILRLKVDQCKIYLRKHGLRLTGTKDILIQRIKEHLEIINGGGEKKYPPLSFVVNCQGDACTGDVVLFEQNVYEMFSIVSRSANGPPCGTRVIAGRILKESYGAAKQQHTFTIEVLWSKGEKPLPPLHPLLIKGRNLYRLKTMRQKWEDEGERKRILTEKHARGCVARSKSGARVQRREMRNKLKSNRVLESKDLNRIDKENRKRTTNSLSISLTNLTKQPQQKGENVQDTSQAQCLKERPNASMKANMPFDRLHIQRQPLTSMNGKLFRFPFEMTTHGHYFKSKHSTSSGQPSFSDEGPEKHNMLGSNINELSSAPVIYAYQKSINHETLKSSSQGHHGSSMQKHFYHGNPNFNPLRSGKQTHGHAPLENFNTAEGLVPCSRPENSKLCRYYAQGRCYYGQNCRYLHQ